MKTHLETLLYISFGLLVSFVVVFLTLGCGTTDHKKRLLEQMNPGCVVTDDLTIICEPPDED
jgi:hypothetical protein